MEKGKFTIKDGKLIKNKTVVKKHQYTATLDDEGNLVATPVNEAALRYVNAKKNDDSNSKKDRKNKLLKAMKTIVSQLERGDLKISGEDDEDEEKANKALLSLEKIVDSLNKIQAFDPFFDGDAIGKEDKDRDEVIELIHGCGPKELSAVRNFLRNK